MINEDNIVLESEQLMDRVRQQIENGPHNIVVNSSSSTAIPTIPVNSNIADNELESNPPLSPVKPPQGDPDAPSRIKQYFLQRQNTRQSTANSELPNNSPIISPPVSPAIISPQSREYQYNYDDIPITEGMNLRFEPSIGPSQVFHYKAPSLEDPLVSFSNVTNPYKPNERRILNGRNVEEEGLWIPDPIACKNRNHMRLSNRLFWDDPNLEYYFGANGQIRNDSPVIRDTNPPFFSKKEENVPEPCVDFFPASVWGVEDIEITRDLRIEVSEVSFLIHPLSTVEDILVTKMKQLYKAFTKDQEFSKSNYYRDKIKATRAEIEQLEKKPENIDKEKALLKQLIEAYDSKDFEEHNNRMLRDSLITCWNELKEYRVQAKYTINELSLKWKNKVFNQAEIEKQQSQFEEVLKKRAIETVRFAEINGKMLNIDDTIEGLRNRHRDLGLRLPGEPVWKPILADNADVTPYQLCPPQEKERRRLLKSARVFLIIKIGKNTTVKSYEMPINNLFSANTDMIVNFQVTQVPQNVICEIWESGYIEPRCIGSIVLRTQIGVPPEPSSYDFSSNQPDMSGRIISGQVMAKCFIEPDPESLALNKAQANSFDKTKKLLSSDPSRFMSVPKLLEWAMSHDPNDPYMSSMVASVVARHTSDRVSGRFKLDPQIETVNFAAYAPTSISHQIHQHLQRLNQERTTENQRIMENGDTVKIRTVGGSSLLLENIVRMPKTPSFGEIFEKISNFFFRRRKLRPSTIERPYLTVIEPYHRVVIRLIQPYNAPERTQIGCGPDTVPSRDYAAPIGDASPNVFARVFFDDVRVTKATMDSWDETFEFPLLKDEKAEVPPLNYFADKNIRIDIYDHMTFSQIHGQENEEITVLMHEDRYLGTINIPLRGLWSVGEIYGAIPVQIPTFQLGYYSVNPNPMKIMAHLSFNPKVMIPESVPIMESCESIEIRLKAQRVLQEYSFDEFTKKRRICLMAMISKGEPVILSRMILPQRPPPECLDPYSIVRFVSMIPNVPDIRTFGTSSDIWCTSQEFLDMQCGDEEEHAVLLCNYLKYIGRDSYVVLGYDFFSGNASYVLTISNNGPILISPLNGKVTLATDINCDMFSIGVVFNENNIWINIQNEVSPQKISWEFEDEKCWYSFFNKKHPLPPMAPLQQEELVYIPPDEENALRIENEIYNNLRTVIEEDRIHLQTKWNDHLSKALKDVLPLCERESLTQQFLHIGSNINKISRKFKHYRLNGSPFCIPFLSFEGIVEEIRARGQYLANSDLIEFGLGLYVVPMPNKMYIVWIFLAYMQPVPYDPSLEDELPRTQSDSHLHQEEESDGSIINEEENRNLLGSLRGNTSRRRRKRAKSQLLNHPTVVIPEDEYL